MSKERKPNTNTHPEDSEGTTDWEEFEIRQNNAFARKFYDGSATKKDAEDWTTVFTEVAGYRDKFASGIEHTADLVKKVVGK